MSTDWDNTTFVRCPNMDVVRRALDSVLEPDGFRRIPKPDVRFPAGDDPMVVGPLAHCNVVAVAMVKGKLGWTALKCAPLDLLGPGGNAAKMAILCAAIGCEGIQHHVYEDETEVLLEVDLTGHLAISSSPRATFERLDLEGLVADFDPVLADVLRTMLPHPPPGLPEADAGDHSRALHKALVGKRVDNLIVSGVLASCRELALPNSKAVYYGRKL